MNESAPAFDPATNVADALAVLDSSDHGCGFWYDYAEAETVLGRTMVLVEKFGWTRTHAARVVFRVNSRPEFRR